MKKSILAALALILTTFTMDAQVQLQVTGEHITLNKTYDGTTDVNFTQGSLSGVQAGDTVSLTTTAAYVSSGAADSVDINVTYQISGPQAGNYLAPANRVLNGKIVKKQIQSVVTIISTKPYDGTRTANVSGVSYSGIVGTDDVNVTYVSLYDTKFVGQNKSITTSFSISGADTANYYAPATSYDYNGVITAIRTTLATQPLLNYTKIYDATNAVTVLNHGTLNGVLAGDDVQLVETATYSSADVGDSLDVTLTYSFTGTDAGNYIAPDAQLFSGVGKINRKRLTVSTPTTVTTSKVYDRTASCVVTSNGTAGGVMGSDRITLLATARYQDSLVGQNKTVFVTYRIYGQGSTNYLAPDDDVLFADITPLKLNIMPCTLQRTKVYDADVSANVQAGALRNVKSGDSVNITTTAVYDNKNVGTNKRIYVSHTIDGPDAGNYEAPDNDTVQFCSITPATVTVTGTTVQRNRVYDSTTGAAVTDTGTIAPLLGSDNVGLSAAAWYNDKNVGTNKAITIRYTLTGADAANYATPNDSILSGSITPFQLTMAQHSTVDTMKVYDGTVNCSVATDGSLAGVFSNDDVHLRTTATYLTADADSGKRVILAYSIYGNDSANYIAPDTAFTTAGIAPRQLLIAPCQTPITKVYDASDSATVVPGVLTNRIPGDSVNVVATAVYDDKNAGTSKDIYVTYSIQGADVANYIAPVADTLHNNVITPLTINSRGIILSLRNVYNGTTQVATVYTPGTIPYLRGDNVTLHATAIYDDKNVGTGKHVTINFTLTGPDSANYIVPSVDTLGDITPLTLYFQQHSTVIPTKVYDGTTTCVKATDGVLSGVIAGDDITLRTTAAYLTPTVGTYKDVCVRYHLTGIDSANYRLYSDTMHTTADITPRQLTVSNWSVVTTKAYDETDSVHIINTGVLNNALPADMLVLTTTARYDTSAIGQNRRITISFRATGPGIANYVQPADTVITGTITKVKLIVSGTTLDDTVYNGSTACPVLFRGHIMNKVNHSHDVDIVPTAVFNDHRAGRNKPVTVTYTLTGADAVYYEVPDPDTTLRANIDPLQIFANGTTVTATRPYDGTTDCNVSVTGSLVGVLGSDSVTLSATAAYTDRHVGTDKPVTATYTIQGPDAANYIAPADNTTLTASITAVPLIVVNTTATLVKEYDANTTAQATGSTPILLNPADQVTVIPTGYYLTPDIEQGKSVYVSFALSGIDKDDYIAPADTLFSILGEITRRKLVQTGTQVVSSRIYDSTTRITVTDNGTLANLLPGDSVTFTLTSAAYCDKHVGTNKEVYVRGTISGPDVSKYVLDYCETIYADITEKLITIKGTTPANKVYDGTPNAQILTNGTVDGAFAGDYVTVGTATATYSTIYPTSNATVTIHYTLTGTDAHNYTVSDNVYTNMVISPATLRIRTNTLDVVRSKVYDATDSAHIADFDNTLTAADGVVGNDSVAVSAAAHYSDKNVATGKTITVHFTLSGKDRGNYVYPSDITYRNGVITRREVTIDYNSTIVDTVKTYDGNNTAHVAYAGDISGYIPCDSDKIQLNATAYYKDANVGSGKIITVHYSLLGTEAGNYYVQPTHIYRDQGRIDPAPTDVEVVSEVFDITLAPNPAHVGEMTYLVSDIQGSVTIELLNAAGQRIMTEDDVTFPIEIQAPVATGIYFIRIIADDGRAYIRKLIVK